MELDINLLDKLENESSKLLPVIGKLDSYVEVEQHTVITKFEYSIQPIILASTVKNDDKLNEVLQNSFPNCKFLYTDNMNMLLSLHNEEDAILVQSYRYRVRLSEEDFETYKNYSEYEKVQSLANDIKEIFKLNNLDKNKSYIVTYSGSLGYLNCINELTFIPYVGIRHCINILEQKLPPKLVTEKAIFKPLSKLTKIINWVKGI